jgi:hypothetical protein
MYLIIGGDGKQYGPISGADLRKWIAEGRLSAESLAKAESDAEFRPLSTFPELADAFGVPAQPPGIAPILPAAVSDRAAALDKVKVPAIGLIVSASISLLMSLWSLIRIGSVGEQIQQMDQVLSQMGNPQLQQFMDQFTHFLTGPFAVANYLFQIVIAALILVGALKMLKLKSYQFAYAAAILSVIPCITPCCGWILGLIFGIWAMTVLGKVKSYFS